MTLHKSLLNSINSGKINHAYLLVGSELDCFDQSTELSCYLLCDNGNNCGRCPSCKKVHSGNHPDLQIVEPDGQYIKLKQISRIRHYVNLKSYEGGRGVVVIRDVEKMNQEAANSLLKTLEEPPSGIYFILTCKSYGAVLPTIRSRCIIVRLTETVDDEEELSKAEVEMREEARHFVSMMGQDVSVLFNKTDALKKMSAPDVPNRELIQMFLSELSCCFRDMAVVQIAPACTMLSNHRLPVVLTRGNAIKACEKVSEAKNYLKYNVNTKLVLDVLFLDLKELVEKSRETMAEPRIYTK